MIAGRIVWGMVEIALLGIGGSGGFTVQMFLAGAFLYAVPGIILQFVLIPSVMIVLNRTGLVPFKKSNAIVSE